MDMSLSYTPKLLFQNCREKEKKEEKEVEVRRKLSNPKIEKYEASSF
jgi:hypothetical protein